MLLGLRARATMALSNYMVQTEDGQWRLGPAAGWLGAMGEREPELSSVAAPVFGLNWRLLGSICISGPTLRPRRSCRRTRRT